MYESIHAFVQLPTFHFVFKVTICSGRQPLRLTFEVGFFEGFAIACILKKWVHTIQMLLLKDLKHTPIHSVKQGKSFEVHHNSIAQPSHKQHVFF